MTSSSNAPKPIIVTRKGGIDPALRDALSLAENSRAGTMASPAPKVKDDEVKIIEAALDHPPQRPDVLSAIISTGGSVTIIVTAVRDMMKGPIVGGDVVLMGLGIALFVAQLATYLAARTRVSGDVRLQQMARDVIRALKEQVAGQSRNGDR